MKKNILKKIKSLFAEEETYIEVKTEDGKILRVYSDVVAVDVAIEEVTEDGMVALEDADYKLEDGSTLVVAGGMITEIKEAEAKEETEIETEDLTDKKFNVVKKHFESIVNQISKWEMTFDQDTFEIGTQVTMSYEYDGNTEVYNAYSGTYELEDGRIITLSADGIVLLITDAQGTVLEAPKEGDNITGDATTTVTTPEDEATDTEVEEAMSKLETKFSAMEKELKEWKDKYENLAKSPGAKPTNTKIDFSKTDYSANKPKSKLHDLI